MVLFGKQPAGCGIVVVCGLLAAAAAVVVVVVVVGCELLAVVGC